MQIIILSFDASKPPYRTSAAVPEQGVKETELYSNSKHWFTISFLQPLPYLVTR